MIEVIDCKSIADAWLSKSRQKILREELSPTLTIISLGEPDHASSIYIRNKIAACDAVGIDTRHIIFSGKISKQEIIMRVKEIAEEADAWIIQSPSNLDNLAIEELRYNLPSCGDVDCMSFESIGRLRANEECFYPATVSGILHLLRTTGTKISGKRAVVIGRSEIVGRPMADVLTNQNATVTLCHSKTTKPQLEDACLKADILISATGKTNLITPDMVNSRCFVIDVGINRDEKGRLCGDCSSVERWNDRWVWSNDIKLTPVPGGVGKLTVAGLVRNVVKAAEMKNGI